MAYEGINQVPEHIQEAFQKRTIETGESLGSDIKKIVPEQLFAVLLVSDGSTRRSYYSYDPRQNGRFIRSFPTSSTLSVEGGQVKSVHLEGALNTKIGVLRGGINENTFRFTNDEFGRERLSVNISEPAYSLHAEYLEGVLEAIFPHFNGPAEVDPHTFLIYPYYTHNQPGWELSDGSVLSAENDDTFLYFERTIEGVIEKFQVQKRLDLEYIKWKLVKTTTLQDPINAALEDDDCWKNADLRELSGIKVTSNLVQDSSDN